jgi:hypothetical protein
VPVVLVEVVLKTSLLEHRAAPASQSFLDYTVMYMDLHSLRVLLNIRWMRYLLVIDSWSQKIDQAE